MGKLFVSYTLAIFAVMYSKVQIVETWARTTDWLQNSKNFQVQCIPAVQQYKCHEKKKSRQSKDKWRDKKITTSVNQGIRHHGWQSKVRQHHERWDSRKDGGSCTSCSMISMSSPVMPTRLNVFWEAMTNLARRTGSSSAKVYSLPSSDRSPQAHLFVSIHWSACCGYVKLGLLRVLLQDGQLYRYRYGTWYEQNKCNLCMFLSSPMKIMQMLEHPNKSNGYRIPFILISSPPHSWDQHDTQNWGVSKVHWCRSSAGALQYDDDRSDLDSLSHNLC